jgi:dihydroflavonol-4-reductase
MVRQGGSEPEGRLSFFAADLTNDAGWTEAVSGCDYVLHIASPLPASVPKHEDELIIPAREGALRVLQAARDCAVKRVVLTSSFAAIGYGQAPRARPFDETDWTDPKSRLTFYAKSKAVAERAAWDFIAREGRDLELSVVNPVAVFGPVLGPDFSASIQIVKRMMTGGMPACPQFHFGVVDVRDVAELHIRAMTEPAAKGERFLAVAGDFMSLRDIAVVLKNGLGAAAGKVSTWQLPNWLFRAIAIWNADARATLPELGKVKNGTSEKARRILGWAPRSREEAIVATAESLLRLGILQAGK